jgi:membrane protein CcdC involved in cytochrome C biogenesis
MKSLLLPRIFKWIGILMFMASFIIGVDYAYDVDDVQHSMGLGVQLLSFFGLVPIAGSRLKIEDERTLRKRLLSIQIAVIIFACLRVGMKCIAFYTKDPTWLPVNLQFNFLLILYIFIFYSQTKLMPLFNKKEIEEA